MTVTSDLLGGRWRATVATDQARRTHPDPGLDDRDWSEVTVPGHWCDTPALRGDGPVLYRHRFETDRAGAGRRSWLTFDGAFYQADVWFDGSYLGDTEGYFAPHTFEVTDQLRAGREHLLAVELACPAERDPSRRSNLTGAFQDPATVGPGFNPGGIWAPVRVGHTGPVRLASLRVACREATPQRAVLDLAAVLDSDQARRIELTSTVTGPTGSEVAGADDSHTLAQGPNRVSWRVTVERPELWWPRALGDQPLHELRVSVTCDGTVSDERSLATGLRRVRTQRFVTTVNGERLFLKGAGIGPTTPVLATVDPDAVRRDVDLGVAAGLDLLRVRAHVGHPALYDHADRVGLLLWQDLPLQGRFGGARRQAVRQARAAVDLLAHHPSVALWCGHDGAVDDGGRPGRGVLRRAARQAVPHPGSTRLDLAVRRAIERADPSRPVLAHDGALPHPAWASDSRLTPGWYDTDDLPATIARWPALARFVSGLAPASVPPSADFVEPGRWPDLDWDRLAADHRLRPDLMATWVPPGAHPDFASWQAATQARQAEVVARAVRELRRRKYRPTGGFCVRLLADARPSIAQSLVDHRRQPKPAYAALGDACAPVIVAADPLPPALVPGAGVDLAVHVVNDRRVPLDDATVVAELTWPGGRRTWRWAGSVGADSCALVGRVRATLPADAGPGPVRLEHRLSGPDGPIGVACVTNSLLGAAPSGSRGDRRRTIRAGQR